MTDNLTSANPMAWVAAGCFALAILHTFCVPFFHRLADQRPRHAGVWHLLGEVEVVFGLWAFILALAMLMLLGPGRTLSYLNSRTFTEPLFVFSIMVIAGTKPVLWASGAAVRAVSQGVALRLRASPLLVQVFLLLSCVPLLGSLITEPAAMTLAALMLRDTALVPHASERLKYLVLGALFVNISIGGTLTPFAAPPVLMVASAWGWDLAFMLEQFGWRASLAVVVNAAWVCAVVRTELRALERGAASGAGPHDAQPARATTAAAMPLWVVGVNLLLLAAVVLCAHHPVVFLGLLLAFIGFATAYPAYHDRLILREALLVAAFLSGLVVLGGQQAWWLQPLLMGMDEQAVFYGAVALTAVTDNAALTYLGTLVPGLSDGFKTALVAGAVAGGGLTAIANAPNPAGIALLKDRFRGGAVGAGGLLAAAAVPTGVAVAVFRWL